MSLHNYGMRKSRSFPQHLKTRALHTVIAAACPLMLHYKAEYYFTVSIVKRSFPSYNLYRGHRHTEVDMIKRLL